MSKKIILAVFGGIALVGLLVALVGFTMGGRADAITVEGGEFVYTGSDTGRVVLAKAPRWAGRRWLWWPWSRLDDVVDEAMSAASAPAAPDAPIAPSTPDAPASLAPAAGQAVELPFAADQLRKLDINISAGFLVIQRGDGPALSVDGPLEYTSVFDHKRGEWTIQSKYDRQTFRSMGRRILRGDADVTTTFTITLPEGMDELDLKIDMGEAEITGLSLRELECTTDMGGVTLADVTAAEAKLKVNLGSINAKGMDVGSAELECDLGSLSFQGLARAALEADCDLGSIDLQLAKPQSYTGEAKVELGGITVDGNSQRSGSFSGSFSGGGSYTPHLELECGLGSIVVAFR